MTTTNGKPHPGQERATNAFVAKVSLDPQVELATFRGRAASAEARADEAVRIATDARDTLNRERVRWVNVLIALANGGPNADRVLDEECDRLGIARTEITVSVSLTPERDELRELLTKALALL